MGGKSSLALMRDPVIDVRTRATQREVDDYFDNAMVLGRPRRFADVATPRSSAPALAPDTSAQHLIAQSSLAASTAYLACAGQANAAAPEPCTGSYNTDSGYGSSCDSGSSFTTSSDF